MELPVGPHASEAVPTLQPTKRPTMKQLMCALVVLSSTAVFAQTEKVVQEPDRVVPRLNQLVDFVNGPPVEGTIKRPSDSLVFVRAGIKFNRMIKIRGDFVPELQKSVDNL
jgi:hypothetical protein